jgi:cyanophycin synthetase
VTNLSSLLRFSPPVLFNLARRYVTSKRPEERAIKANRSAYYADAWASAATRTGSTLDALGSDVFKITNGARAALVSHQATPLNDAVSNKAFANRAVVYELLVGMAVPVPRFVHLRRNAVPAAEEFMASIGGRIVVKPAYGTGSGAGVTTNVSRPTDVRRAIAWARAFCPEIVLEEQVEGNLYRLLILDGELIDGVVRHPPTVIGDGTSTIRELIERENRTRSEPGARRAQNLIRMNLDARNTLAAQGLSLKSQPAAGQQVKVKHVVNENRADENEYPPEGIAPFFAELGEVVFRETGVRLVGIDVIAPTLADDLATSGGRVIELNTPPGHFYHDLRHGQGFPVAVRLLEKLLDISEVET